MVMQLLVKDSLDEAERWRFVLGSCVVSRSCAKDW
jgi:hypothetical protein